MNTNYKDKKINKEYLNLIAKWHHYLMITNNLDNKHKKRINKL